MYRKILVGIDGNDHGRDALALGGLIATRTAAELIAAHVYPSTGPFRSPELAGWEQTRDVAERVLEETIADVDVGLEHIGHTTLEGTSPAQGLHDLAEAEEADVIVVGSPHRGSVGRALAGTVGLTLLHGSPCAVAIAPADFRKQGDTALRVIGVGYDGTPESEVALDGAIDLARSVDALLRIVTVASLPPIGFQGKGFRHASATEMKEAIAEEMQEALDRALERIPDGIEAFGHLVSGTWNELADQEDIDLMMVGSRGYGPLRRVLLGSVSSHLVRAASYPLIVVPRGAPTNAGPPAEAGTKARVIQDTVRADGSGRSLVGAGSRPAMTYWPL
jgi:nucleotide-binding universal stress UspA family protein